MSGNYWSRITASRLGRRKLLAAGSTAALGTAFLVACGGDDETTDGSTGTGSGTSTSTGGQATGGSTGPTGAQSTGSGSLITRLPDTTSQAKPGGTVKDWAAGDAVHMDALASNAHGVINFISAFAYPRMLRFETPVYPKMPDGTLDGEAAQSFELSPDKLTLTFKVRESMKWDARSPTDGRVLDAEDVLFSWSKFEELNQSAANMSANRSPVAPIESISAPDSQTIVFNMRQPDSSLLGLFASWDHFYLMPRESEGGFDPRQTVRGHGPWVLEEYVPSVKFVWAKNPDYFLENRPWPDYWERPIIPEYTSRLTQFRAGEILTPVATPTDILQTKKDVSELILNEEATANTSIWNGLAFGYEDDSPFKDPRVRQAVSLLIDPDGYVDVMDNRALFAAEGIELDAPVNTIVAAGWGDFWLDPTDEAAFGENAKYLGHNVDEAKKLLGAAGYPDGFKFDMYFSSDRYAADYLESVQLMGGMLFDGDLEATMNGFPYEQYKDTYYEAYYGPSYESGKTSGFNGIIHLANPSTPSVASHLFTFVHKDGGRYHGMTPDGNNAHLGDPRLNSDIENLKLEFDRDEQIALVHDLIRYFTGQSYYIPRPARTRLVTLTWPALENFDVYQPSPSENQWSETNLQWWINQTKPPFA